MDCRNPGHRDVKNSSKMVKTVLIIKMLQQHRHTGMDCRYPDYMDVMFTSLPWLLDSGNPCRKDVILALAEVSL
jgi:hypothetical protein